MNCEVSGNKIYHMPLNHDTVLLYYLANFECSVYSSYSIQKRCKIIIIWPPGTVVPDGLMFKKSVNIYSETESFDSYVCAD